MTVQASQIAAARELLGWKQRDLALEAGISLYALQRVETTPGNLAPNRHVDAVLSVLIAKGAIFTVDSTRIGVSLELGRR